MIRRLFCILPVLALPVFAFAGAPDILPENIPAVSAEHPSREMVLQEEAPSRMASVAAIGASMQARYGAVSPRLWGENIPGVVSRLENTDAVALTLDACEGATDMRIIALLRKHRIPAVIFATNIWLRNNKTIAADLAADPLFTFAAHGKRHKPASVNGRSAFGVKGTRSIPALVEEVEDNARAIEALTGRRLRWYRSGTAHYDDVAVNIIHDLGLKIAGFTVSADAGATLPAEKVARLMLAVPKGAIILCHCNRPESGTFAGLARAIPIMLEKGVRFVSLEQFYADTAPEADSLTTEQAREEEAGK